MPDKKFIKNYERPADLVSFLQEKISILEHDKYPNQYDYIEQLSIEERILLITLMYVGRGDASEGNYYKTNFYKLYEINYNSWVDDKHLTSQMLGKAPFFDYLKDAISMYEKVDTIS